MGIPKGKGSHPTRCTEFVYCGVRGAPALPGFAIASTARRDIYASQGLDAVRASRRVEGGASSFVIFCASLTSAEGGASPLALSRWRWHEAGFHCLSALEYDTMAS